MYQVGGNFMKRSRFIIVFLIIATLAIGICGCNKSDGNAVYGYNNEYSIITDIPLIGKLKQRVLYSAYGKIGSSDQPRQVLILSDYDNDKLMGENTYLAVLSDGEILTYDLGMCWPASIVSYDMEKIIFADVDGDSYNEIVLNTYINGNKATLAMVLKVENGAISLVKDLNDVVNEEVFRCEYLEGRKVRIYNDEIGFEAIKDISNYSDEFFDADGVGKSTSSRVYCLYAVNCTVSDDNGMQTLQCERLLKLDTDAIMTVKMTYRYGKDKNNYILCNTEELNPKAYVK